MLQQQQVPGAVMYAMTCKGPDLAYAVKKLAQYASDRSRQHWISLRHLRYLTGKYSRGIWYSESRETKEPVMYADSNWAAEQGCRILMYGCVLAPLEGVVLVSSAKQSVVAFSTSEAEYIYSRSRSGTAGEMDPENARKHWILLRHAIKIDGGQYSVY